MKYIATRKTNLLIVLLCVNFNVGFGDRIAHSFSSDRLAGGQHRPSAGSGVSSSLLCHGTFNRERRTIPSCQLRLGWTLRPTSGLLRAKFSQGRHTWRERGPDCHDAHVLGRRRCWRCDGVHTAWLCCETQERYSCVLVQLDTIQWTYHQLHVLGSEEARWQSDISRGLSGSQGLQVDCYQVDPWIVQYVPSLRPTRID